MDMQQGMSKGLTVLMAAATGLIVANVYYNQPLIVMIAQTFGVSESNAGQISFLTQVGYALGLFFCVPLGDWFERKRQILVMAFLSALALFAAAFSNSLLLLKITAFMIGFTSVVPQLILPLAANLTAPEKRGKIIGFIMSGLLIGILLSRTLSGVVGAHLGWRAMFGIAGAICLVLMSIMAWVLPQNRPDFKGSYGELMGSLFTLIKTQPVLREASVITACAFASFGLFWIGIVFLLSGEPYHFTSDKVGLMGLAAAAGALGAPLIGKVSDKKNPRIAIGYGLGLILLSFILFYFFRNSLWMLVLGIVLLDLGLQGAHISNQTRIYALNPEARNRINTVYMTTGFIGTSIGSGVGLWVWDMAGWTGVCAAGVVFMVIAFAVYVLTFSTKK
jgi:predicted MFS family arabinose efflux permease